MTVNTLPVALVQLCAGEDPAANRRHAEAWLEQAMQGAATYIRWGGGFGGFDGCGALALAAGCRPWRGLASSILPLLASGRTSTFCILRHAGLHRPLAPLLNLRN